MGKKKIGTEDSAVVLKQASDVDAAVVSAATKTVAKRVGGKGRVYVKASYNNTIITITDDKGAVLAWSTAGTLGFKGPKKATPFAAGKIIATLTEKLRKAGINDITIYVTGIGGGRDSSIRSLVNQGFNILGIYDMTPVPHNGPKPKKVRRV